MRLAVIAGWLSLVLWLAWGVVLAEETAPITVAAGAANDSTATATRDSEKKTVVKTDGVTSGSDAHRTADKKKPTAVKKNAKKTKKPVRKSVEKTPMKLNLHLPSTALPTDSADVNANDPSSASLPDLFTEKPKQGRVSLDGKFLFEEDVEAHPGAGTDTVRSSKDQTEQQKSQDWLEGVEGAELRLRVHTD